MLNIVIGVNTETGRPAIVDTNADVAQVALALTCLLSDLARGTRFTAAPLLETPSPELSRLLLNPR